MRSSSSGRAQSTPMPIGPHILCPLNAMKSQSSSRAENAHVRHRLRGVDAHQRAGRVGALGDRADVVDGAEHVGLMPDGDQSRRRGEQLVERAQVERPSSSMSIAASCRPRRSAASCHGTRLLWCSMTVTTMRSPGSSSCVAYDDATRLIASVVLRTKTRPSAGASMNAATRARALLEGVGRLVAERVHAAMHVGVAGRVVGVDGVDDRARLLRGRGRVEVDERMRRRSRAGGSESRRGCGRRRAPGSVATCAVTARPPRRRARRGASRRRWSRCDARAPARPPAATAGRRCADRSSIRAAGTR